MSGYEDGPVCKCGSKHFEFGYVNHYYDAYGSHNSAMVLRNGILSFAIESDHFVEMHLFRKWATENYIEDWIKDESFGWNCSECYCRISVATNRNLYKQLNESALTYKGCTEVEVRERI